MPLIERRYSAPAPQRVNAHGFSLVSLLPANLHNHLNVLEHCVRVDRVIAVLYNNLPSPGREPRELWLNLMDPDVMKMR